MKRTIAAISLGLVPLALLALPVSAQPQKEAADKHVPELRKLEQERVATLTRLVRVLQVQCEQGGADFTKFADAQRELLNAQLELADSRQGRIAVLKAQAKISKEVLRLMEARFESGFHVTEADVDRAKVDDLDVRIRLLREHIKLKSN